jgi:two-component system sensor histidine kinase KdpD
MRGRQNLLPYLKSALAVAVVAIAGYVLTLLLPLPHATVLFITAVIASAALWGLGPSLFAVLLSVTAKIYLIYTPIFRFKAVDPHDIADLAVFILVAIFVAVLTSRLADGMRRQAIDIADARLKAQGEALREALINSVSHDLQTPLAAILGSASVLETMGEHGEPRARRELVASIREEAERLTSHIGNVLDLTRVRAGQMAPRLELVELSDIINSALQRKEKALAGHVLQVDVPASVPMLRLDLFLMEHALANVLDNAAKYSPSGSTVRVTARATEGGVVLEIADEGRGVRAADLERAFEAFYRGSQQESGAAAGSGLGLAICRAFVEANGGRVTLSSAGPAGGARVQIQLPRAA